MGKYFKDIARYYETQGQEELAKHYYELALKYDTEEDLMDRPMNKFEIYDEFVKGKMKSGAEVLGGMGTQKAHLVHQALGIMDECGELGSALKKHTIYNQPLDVENVLEEVGDIMFYCQGILSVLGYTLEDALHYNVDKLEKRYPTGYSDKLAKDRLDKQS